MTTRAPSRDTVVADLRNRGFETDDEGWATVARGGSASPADVDGSLAVVPLGNGRPLTVVSAVANAAHEGHVPALVCDRHTAETAEPLLAEPFLLRGRRDGARAFHSVEDRIELRNGRYACTAAEGAMEWAEAADGATDDPPLTLRVGGETVAALDSVGGLACPGPSASAFRYSYDRGADGLFRVYEDDRPVGRYTGVGAMRADGVRPVPLPLVPEHHVRDGGRLARATVLAVVERGDGGVDYRSPSGP